MTQMTTQNPSVDLLILGSGWVSTYLITLLKEQNVIYKGTKRTVTPEQPDMIQFSFDPESNDSAPFSVLPSAKTIIITFPIKGHGGSKRLVDLYLATHSQREPVHFVQLGSTGMWDASEPSQGVWKDRHSLYDKSNVRAQAEDELLSLSSPSTPTTVLNLCGLWGGSRQPKNWLSRVAPSKDALSKRGSLHLIHGADVARAIHAVHQEGGSEKTSGQRWIITNTRIYDWWDVAASWGGELYPLWVRELMKEQDVRALPRAPELLGRALDGREFWDTFSMEPTRTRLDQD